MANGSPHKQRNVLRVCSLACGEGKWAYILTQLHSESIIARLSELIGCAAATARTYGNVVSNTEMGRCCQFQLSEHLPPVTPSSKLLNPAPHGLGSGAQKCLPGPLVQPSRP
ncbi:unnamed protein product [Leuciscus chuanchicus]